MNLVRHADVFAREELPAIAAMLKDRTWTVQSSNAGDATRFFMSGLAQTEIDLFHRRLGPLVNRYIADNGVKGAVGFERAYVNCHPAFHPGHWHIDNHEGFTALYYPPSEIDFGDEGGTDVQGFGYQRYLANGLILFPANALHMAREHTAKGVFRYSVAFKFQM